MSEIHASREDAKARRNIEEVAAIVVDGQLIVDRFIHPKQLLTYLRLMNLPPLGLLINFASSRLRVHQQEAPS